MGSKTATPEVNIDIDLLYMLNNISALLDVNWYLGLPFSYPVNISGISEMTGIFEQVLGDKLIALQLGTCSNACCVCWTLLNHSGFFWKVTNLICKSLLSFTLRETSLHYR